MIEWIEVKREPNPRSYPYRTIKRGAFGHRGKRARRQAFYAARRMERAFGRALWAGVIDLGDNLPLSFIDGLPGNLP